MLLVLLGQLPRWGVRAYPSRYPGPDRPGNVRLGRAGPYRRPAVQATLSDVPLRGAVWDLFPTANGTSASVLRPEGLGRGTSMTTARRSRPRVWNSSVA